MTKEEAKAIVDLALGMWNRDVSHDHYVRMVKAWYEILSDCTVEEITRM